MAKRKRPVNTRKQNIIADLIEEYDIETAEDIQDALKDLLGDTIQNMMETELDHHLGYEPYERSSESNARNGKKKKTVRSKYGEVSLNVPQDRDSSFEPKVVKKRRKDIS
jgi:transposase-like protein